MHLSTTTRATAALLVGAMCLAGCDRPSAYVAGTEWTTELTDGRGTDMRIAQAYLARAGRESLSALDALSVSPDAELAERLQEVTSLMLLNSVPWPDLAGAPSLKALNRERFDAVRQLTAPLANAESYDTGETGMGPGPEPTPAILILLAEITSHGGWAVPAALELCADESPSSRLYGAMILVRLEAWGQLEVLHEMFNDEGPVSLFRGCFDEHTTVGKALAAKLEYISTYRSLQDADSPLRIVLEAEAYLRPLDVYEHGPRLVGDTYAAIGEARKRAGTMDATSWDDFWQRSRSVLKDMWGR